MPRRDSRCCAAQNGRHSGLTSSPRALLAPPGPSPLSWACSSSASPRSPTRSAPFRRASRPPTPQLRQSVSTDTPASPLFPQKLSLLIPEVAALSEPPPPPPDDGTAADPPGATAGAEAPPASPAAPLVAVAEPFPGERVLCVGPGDASFELWLALRGQRNLHVGFYEARVNPRPPLCWVDPRERTHARRRSAAPRVRRSLRRRRRSQARADVERRYCRAKCYLWLLEQLPGCTALAFGVDATDPAHLRRAAGSAAGGVPGRVHRVLWNFPRGYTQVPGRHEEDFGLLLDGFFQRCEGPSESALVMPLT